jgi:hypothetical protein
MKACAACGRTTGDTARYCVACKTPFDAPVAAPAGPASPSSASAGCPLCGGARGTGRIKARRIGETREYGIPIVAAVSVTAYEEGNVGGVCASCDLGLFWKQTGAWIVAGLPVAILFVIAGALSHPLLWLFTFVVTVLFLRSIFQTWTDGMMWGDLTVQKLGLPPGYYVPVGLGQVLFRGLVVPMLSAIGLLVVIIVLERLHVIT